LRVVVRVIGRHKDLVQIAMAWTTGVVDLDLASDVASRRTSAWFRCSVYCLVGGVVVCLSAVVRALHKDLRSGSEIVVFHVHVVWIVQSVYPHAIVERNPGRGHVRSTEAIGAVGGTAGCNLRRGEADHS